MVMRTMRIAEAAIVAGFFGRRLEAAFLRESGLRCGRCECLVASESELTFGQNLKRRGELYGASNLKK
jgi:hypothetical protein